MSDSRPQFVALFTKGLYYLLRIKAVPISTD